MKLLAAGITTAVCISLSACADPKEANNDNFSKAISAYLVQAGEQCVLKGTFPRKTTQVGIKKWRALEDAGVVSVTSKSKKADSMFGLVYTTYDLTDKGRLIFKQDKGFCYGIRELVSIKAFTKPETDGTYTLSEISYRYRITDIPKWARGATIQNGFPEIKAAVESDKTPLKASALLFLDDGGWTTEMLKQKQ